MQIQKAEGVLGVKIFERSRKEIITTSEGAKIVAHAKEIIRIFELIKSLKNESSEIKIGLIPTVSPYLLPRIIMDLQKKAEGKKMYFIEGKTAELMEGLNNGNLDAIIITECPESLKISSNLVLKPLYEEEFFLSVPTGHYAQNIKALADVEMRDILQKESVISLEDGHCMKDNLTKICESYNVNNMRSNSTFVGTSIETIKYMIKVGNGIGILPKLSHDLNDKNLHYIKLPNSESRKIVLLHRKNTSKIDILQEIVKIIPKALKSLLKDTFSKEQVQKNISNI
jgi:LysR family hydrogen peroxide-inducible transcriptional activator